MDALSAWRELLRHRADEIVDVRHLGADLLVDHGGHEHHQGAWLEVHGGRHLGPLRRQRAQREGRSRTGRPAVTWKPSRVGASYLVIV